MRRLIALMVLLAGMSPMVRGASRLYLKDGSYQSIREYQIDGERVRYYSTERGDWEEIPSGLVDWSRTKVESEAAEKSQKRESKLLADEEQAAKAAKREVERIPQNAGVYQLEGDMVYTLKLAESKLVNHKGRAVLKVLSPLPIINGKSTLELDGLHASYVVREARPEFYIRLSEEERFGIYRLSALKSSRLVDRIEIQAITKEFLDNLDEVPVFRQQLQDQLFKIWPEQGLPEGEYAVVQFTPGKVHLQVWDFQYSPRK